MMKKYMAGLFLVIFGALLGMGCKDHEEQVVPYLSVSSDTVYFSNAAAYQNLTVDANVEWIAEVDSLWCTGSATGKELRISVEENKGRTVREAHIAVSGGEQRKTVLVRQLGQAAAITFSQSAYTVEAIGEKCTVKITTNAVWHITSPDWIVIQDSVLNASDTTINFVFEVNNYSGTQRRTGEILFREENQEKEVKLTVYQKNLGNYVGEDLDGIAEDIKVKIASGTASSFQSGEGIEFSFDDDKSTYYHSAWNNESESYFPVTLTYSFENQEAIDYMVYYPRNDGGSNGFFKEVEIWARCGEETDFRKLMDKDFEGLGSATAVSFPETLENPVAVKLVVRSGAGDGKGFASCAEMEFYRKNENDFDPFTLFTDVTCSELKEGITVDDIKTCRFPFYKNMALYMLNGKYPADFRIQTYKAYPHPDMQARENKTSPYSRLDNPTGISVTLGEEIVVFTGPMGGYTVSLGLQDLDTPGKDGYGVITYPLKEGVNRIRADKKGLLYVMYHTPDMESAPEVKIHIASGKVNGYFDITKHSAGDWRNLINQAVNTHFDLLGRYSHLTFPVSALKKYTGNGFDLLSLYDEIVYQEQKFMGLEKYGRMFGNRMYLHVMYSNSYMYATSYHTAYAEETLQDILDEKKLKTSACWGPAHEIGHCNQTRPGLKWLGTTEVTNNIHSLYIQTFWGNESRLESESLASEGFTNRYEKAMTNTFARKSAHAAEEDVFCKLVPFWQLELYLDKVLGHTDFYKDVYEYIRENPDLATAGEQQTEFVYICCLTSGLNLLDFFSRWGFLTPVDLTLDDYGSGKLTVTEKRIEEIKNRILALNLPVPGVKFEYITDGTVQLFKNNTGVGIGQAMRNNNQLTMRGFSNVVAYEVYDAENNLVFVSPKNSFTINTSWQEGFKVYAVAVNGDKSELTF